MSAADRYRLDNQRRYERTIADPQAQQWERDAAARKLDELLHGKRCKWCLEYVKAHGDAPCPVLYRFQRRCGKTSMPSDTQAADIRAELKADAINDERAARRKENKAKQTTLF